MQERPNILIVITHDTGRHLGCYGRGVETPNIDRFAEQGVKFTNAFCTAPQCSPSRGSLITGKMPHTNGLIGLTHRGFRLNPWVKTLPALLAQAGYSTHLFGFQHEAPDAHSLGYQHVSEKKGGFSCKRVAPLAIDFLTSAPKEPFFAMVGFSETHRKFPEVDEAPDGIAVPPYLPDHPDVSRDVAGLNILVRRVDDAFGAIADKLDKTGLSQRTLVVLTTDHGIAFPGAKATLFDPGVGIMFLARGGGNFSGGKVIDGLVSNMDITPTLLEITGVTVPDEVEGRSLLPLVSGTSDEIRDELFLELTFHAAFDPIRAVRTRRFKYIRNFADMPWYLSPNVDNSLTKSLLYKEGIFDKPRPKEFLFNLESDPLERNNLIGEPDYEETHKKLRAKLNEWMQDTDDPLLAGTVEQPEGTKVTSPDSYNP